MIIVPCLDITRLRALAKQDKEQLSELDMLFCYVSKLIDAVAETAFLGRNSLSPLIKSLTLNVSVGADYASLQASSRLASAQAQVTKVLLSGND